MKTDFCKNPEKIENYEKALKDNFVGWVIHHRLETHTSEGYRRLVNISRKELIALKMYYDRPPEELIFLTRAGHNSLHHKGKSISEETRNKVSEYHKGTHLSEETKRKISESRTGKSHSEETRLKMSESHKGKHLSEDIRKNISESKKGKHWKLVDGKRVWY